MTGPPRPFFCAWLAASKKSPRGGEDQWSGLIVVVVVQFNRRLVGLRFEHQQVAAQVVDNLFRGIAEERR
jgi:hypothetical protein